jgi:hypothetical protein
MSPDGARFSSHEFLAPIIRRVTRTYRISRGAAAYCVGFALVWFGLLFGFLTVGTIKEIPPDQVPLGVGAALVTILLALAPMLVTLRIPYEVTLRGDEECEFHALLYRRLVRVQQIRSIRSDEGDIYVRYDGGKVHMLMDDNFEQFFIRLVELNPGIEVKGWLRRVIEGEGSGTRNARQADR